jgi:hypothetical protein
VNTPDSCPSDLNRDCAVGVGDLIDLFSSWGECP